MISFKAICYTNILEKIVQNKVNQYLGLQGLLKHGSPWRTVPYTQIRNKILNMGENTRMFVSKKIKIIVKIFIKIEKTEVKSLREKIGV